MNAEELNEHDENHDAKHYADNIESTYQMLSDREHVLKRPHVYLGSTELLTYSTQKILFHKNEDNTFDKSLIFSSEAEYVVALITMFNEIINNSYDEHVKTKSLSKNKRLDYISVEIDVDNGFFKVVDNGGINVVEHKEYQMLLPTMLFGHLRSGSNYNDDERGTTSGLNGLGASLVNVMSTDFIVETAKDDKHYTGVWNTNMEHLASEQVKPYKGHGYTSVQVYPDWSRLSLTGFTDDMVNKLIIRCYEVAAMGADSKKPLTIDINVTKNKETVFSDTITFKAFWEYTKLYEDVNEDFWGDFNDNYEFEIGPSSSDSLESLSIVNSIRTDSGTHVNEIAYQAAHHIRWFLNQKHNIDIKPKQIIDRMRILSKWSINAPDFATQTKESLTTKVTEFGYEVKLTDKFKKSLEKSEIINRLLDYYAAKSKADENAAVRKKQQQKIRPQSIDKLLDASSSNRMECSIFLAEGDSALNGMRNARDSKTQGAFSLGGKFVNSLYRTPAQLMKVNTKDADKSKAKNLCAALGLQFGEGIESCRYKDIMIMADADYDGYCIYAQVVLFLRRFWPDLFEQGRVHRVITPIVYAKKKGKEDRHYYDVGAFKADEEMLVKEKYEIRYIKGLAAIEKEDYKAIIRNPKLQTVINDEHAWETLETWFNDESKGRQDLITALQQD